MTEQLVLDSIPQRDPFLFVDKIIEQTERMIHTQKKLTGEEDFFKGHFPGNPIMPGVLLCEACFQSGAIMMARASEKGVGVVTKIGTTKFKNFARPGDLLDIKIELDEKIAHASYMKGRITVGGKTILQINFQAAVVEKT